MNNLVKNNMWNYREKCGKIKKKEGIEKKEKIFLFSLFDFPYQKSSNNSKNKNESYKYFNFLK